ncbi:MAG: hypothetical protein AMJ75_02040 [Phycisphaerae bacterium SM1_79]|nr:MAG: hypothetical protein AMJ75_02040 [Phycisphaerae bacterium SM1_79]
MAAVWFCLAGSAGASNPFGQFVEGYPVEPFVTMSIASGELDLGEVSNPGINSLAGRLTAHIVANCPHRVEASFTPFIRRGGGGTIPAEDTSVRINGVSVPITGHGVPIVSSVEPTPAGGVDVPIDLEVTVGSVWQYPAGAYTGTLVLTIMAGF